ncbi:MAG: copper amine oxidase N-terminal domain-containing protein [Candidatus Eremiobacteraeota bacterium]|nr:copper amine oxidase N-terminal domain-containing protein [Candidatus Eremiobacteraeota bacterium]
MASADFGSPPSGQIPILFNDRTVYANPDILKRSRVLAALVRGNTLMVPLRSMFEQMGAMVSFDPSTKSVTASKQGAQVRVTDGKNEIIINGESRPLDVPPMIYKGQLLVPVRAMSEALGAYVQWVAERRIAVVRYVPATPAPAPPVGPVATPVPTNAPTPMPVQASYRGFLQAAVAARKNYNEFSASQCCPGLNATGAYAFKDSPFAVKVDYRQDTYVTSDNLIYSANHYTSFETIDGGTALTPVFRARQSTLDGRLEYEVAAPRIYLGVGYLQTATNYGYPHLSAVGFGVEKLPDLERGIGLFGSAFYYPTASGDYTVTDPASSNLGNSYRQQYRILKYDVGLSLVFAHSPAYLYGGFSGDRYAAKQNAPIGQTHDGPYIGLGVKF